MTAFENVDGLIMGQTVKGLAIHVNDLIANL